MKSRVTKKVIKGVTLEDAQRASNEFATGQTKLEKIEAKMNEEINRVKDKYQADITEIKASMAEPQEVLEVFAREQKESWGKKKSHELLYTIIGFRTGTPKVVKDKKFTWEAVLELLKKKPKFESFIRTTEEINKEAILAEQDEKVLDSLKTDCYISVDQDEKFFVQVKKEEVAVAV